MTTSAVSGPLDGPLTRRSLLTLCTAAGLTGLYGLYSATVSPWMIPQNAGDAGRLDIPAAPPPPPENVRMAQQWLPTQDWATKAKYQIRTPDAYIYANEWEPVESDQVVRFRPFAMIYVQENRRSDEPPVTVVSESAYLKFAKKFDVGDPDPGRVTGGALQGYVRIAGPDNLAILGKNFIFTEDSKRLWSDDSVQFAWGQHRGRGFGLQVELISDETAKQSSSVAVTGVQSIRLRRNVAVDLTFGGNDPMPGARPRRSAAKPVQSASDVQAKADGVKTDDAKPGDAKKEDPKADEPIEVRVRSAGPFEFDVEANVATFVDNVRMYRPTGPDRYDSLQCDQLTLMLEPESVVEAAAKAAAPQAEPSEGQDVPVRPTPPEAPHPSPRHDLKDGQREGNFRNLNTRMTLRRLRARGKHVVLISESNDLTAHMTDLIYDVPTRVASLSNPEQVRVNQGSSELRSPGMTLMHDENGRITSVWCQGPGWLKHYDAGTRVLQLAAQWAQQLRKYPDKESGLDVIELEKQALVRQPEQKMGLAADFIRLWIEPQDVEAARPGRSPRDRSSRIRMRRMLAINEVALVSPEMNGETDRLEATFEETPAEAETPAVEARRGERRGVSPTSHGDVAHTSAPSPLPLSPAARERGLRTPNLKLANFLVADTSEAAGPAKKPLPPPAAPKPVATAVSPRPPADFSKPAAKPATAPARVRRTPKNVSPDDPATAEMPRGAQGRAPLGASTDSPIQVLADLIRVRVLVSPEETAAYHVAEVWTDGNVEVTQEHEDGEEPLQVTGEKMHVENRSETDQVLHVSGTPAHVRDRGIHIEGRNVHLDRARNVAWVEGAGLLQLPVKSTLDGQKLDTPQLLDVWWKEKMNFNGDSARFFGDVRCVLNDSRLLCQEMEVQLTQRVSFAGRSSKQPEVKSVDCREGVQFDGTEYLASKLTEVRKGHVARFTLDQVTGKTTAHGPGWMSFWRRGSARRASLGPGLGPGLGAVAAPARAPQGESAAWEYTRVDFTGQSDGNVHQRFTTFEERVQIVYGPVERPLALIDPDELPKDGGWMRCDKLRLQQHVLAGQKAEKGQPQGQMEVLGTGNAEIEGRTFHGSADTISYDEAKGLYILRSFGNHKATIWRQTQVGGNSSQAVAQQMKFIPARNELHLDKTVGLDATQ